MLPRTFPRCAVLLMLCLLLAAAGTWGDVICRPVDGGVSFACKTDAGTVNVVRTLRYQANLTHGLAFQTSGPATQEATGGSVHTTFRLEGSEAAHSSVTLDTQVRSRCVLLTWHIHYAGPNLDFNRWSTGFVWDFPHSVRRAEETTVNRFVEPTGAQPYEVKGDTPYRDLDWQLRKLWFDDAKLVVATRWYDPDWIYKHDLRRAGFMNASLPSDKEVDRTFVMAVFPLAPNDDSADADLAAEASGQPMSMSVICPRLGHLFDVGEAVDFRIRLRNVESAPATATLDYRVWDYDGHQMIRRTESVDFAAGAVREIPATFRYEHSGILFLDAALRCGAERVVNRTTFGVLPSRPLSPPRPESPFGLAAIIANSDTYPDQFDLDKVLQLAQRTGVRWLRGSTYSLQREFTADDDARAKAKMALLQKYGISLHAQLGARVPSPDKEDDFRAELRATLERYRGQTPYIEIGNELNFSTSAADYVSRMLKPIHDVTREVFPDCRIMSMGLGGVDRKWLDAFVQVDGMNLIDILSVHPGCHPRAPEFWEGWRGWVFRSQMLDALDAAHHAGGKAVWITEAYAPTPPARNGLDVRTSADYLVRTYVISIGLGVPVVEWYQFQDGVWYARRPNPADTEYNFGIVYTDLTPKPAYIAYGIMTSQLEGAKFVGRLDLGAEDLYGLRFTRNGGTIDVLWSYREKHATDVAWYPPEKYKGLSRIPMEPWQNRWRHPVTINLPAAGEVTVTDLMGVTRRVKPDGGKVTLDLTGSPVYVRGLAQMPIRANVW